MSDSGDNDRPELASQTDDDYIRSVIDDDFAYMARIQASLARDPSGYGSSDDENENEGSGEMKDDDGNLDNEEEEGNASQNLYMNIGGEDNGSDDEFGEFIAPIVHRIPPAIIVDSSTTTGVFSIGKKDDSDSDECDESISNSDTLEHTKMPNEPTIAPLSKDKIEAIKNAMSKVRINPKLHPGAHALAQMLGEKKLRVGDEIN
jgi:hypothetical protein